MTRYAGIDVSLESASVCMVDGTGKVLREAPTARRRAPFPRGPDRQRCCRWWRASRAPWSLGCAVWAPAWSESGWRLGPYHEGCTRACKAQGSR